MAWRRACATPARPVDYQEFKKSHFKTLTKRMGDLGFVKGKNTTPTYWRYPCEDERLAWVIRFQFSSYGNPSFNILIGPYWKGHMLDSGDGFPNCVGYKAHVMTEGMHAGVQTWDASEAQLARAVDIIGTEAPAFFSSYASPQSLLKNEPSGKLAFDLGEHATAYELLQKDLIDLYEADYTASACSKAGQLMHREDLLRHETCLRQTAAVIATASDAEQRILLAKGEAARRMVNTLRNSLRRDPTSRWAKKALASAEAQVLASGLQMPNPRPMQDSAE